MALEKLVDIKQIKVGTYLKIVPLNDSKNYSYEKISVKFIVDNGLGNEVIIDRDRNYYFNLDLLLKRESNWVKEVFVYKNEIDKEARLMLGKRGRDFKEVKNFFKNDWNCERADPEGFKTCREVGHYRCEYCENLDVFNSYSPITSLQKMKGATQLAHYYLMDQDWKCEKRCKCELCEATRSAKRILNNKSIKSL